ncbi:MULTISPECIES: FKBP-type peptidyl-prolyl cis-trans isomerase [Pseudidiomarina]|uniref:Peptidyl-prolyl cis-trans isomerase n=2 Tax=Pseudidiomarina TaxID=2800384 RepID=A0A432XFU8_9GAMM|nr:MULTISPECIES: FKBP-type peptidyl-prolyl cis-trans isomerase [Pseudidiomarina]RUO47624.1 peptidylprolyl isomerase [Pseudidiomarina aquimaris]RUO56189.1 peptidylprolyl isomerase [Pseudidiomarina homiensis]|tara:strand:- start:2185 stop:2622 length:438 start_codon:yes stop_codon:yes gene_type:complete
MISRLPIEHGREVILHFTIKLTDDSVADSTKMSGKPAKFRMGDGSLTENFESCLVGLKAGDEREFELAPEDAFGEPNKDNYYQVETQKFAELPEVGQIFTFPQPDGTELPGIVRSINEQFVTIDFNHPLAGQRVRFAVEIIEVNP